MPEFESKDEEKDFQQFCRQEKEAVVFDSGQVVAITEFWSCQVSVEVFVCRYLYFFEFFLFSSSCVSKVLFSVIFFLFVNEDI